MTRSLAVALAVLGMVTADADAGPGPAKIMVLPLDGDADAPIRAKFSASVQRLARVLDGKVSPGTTTLADSATAIGCDPSLPACADDVRATLGVDELVHGTVTVQNGQLVLVVRRTAKGKPPREVSATLGLQDAPERAEPMILPVFSASDPDPPRDLTTAPDAGGATTATGPESRLPGDPGDIAFVDQPKPRRDRTHGIIAVAGGGTMLLIGFALWSSASGVEDEIDRIDPQHHADFVRLVELEDKASSRAWVGNAVVLAGLALGGYGGWLLYRDHRAHRVVVTPTVVDGGAGVAISIAGGL